MLDMLNKLDEINYSGITRKQRSITRLFPEFPARVRSVANKGGIRLLEMQPDFWHFKIHSGTKDNIWYDAYIKFKDLIEFLGKHVGDKRLWTMDKQHVDLVKLAKRVMFDCEMQVKCNCPAFQYWGPAYILSLRKYDGKFDDRETRPPRIRNPRQYGAICKHMQALLNAYPFYITTLAGFLRDYHTRQIRYLENEAVGKRVGYKKAAAELGRRKTTKEEEPREPEVPAEEKPEGEEEPKESIVKEAMKDRLGDCYRLAGRYVMDNEGATLVHGTINGVRWTGRDYDNPHAWVEYDDKVFDPVHDKEFGREVYYEIMQAKVEKKYNHEEAAKAMLKAENWGPWESRVREDFEDIFQPITRDELMKRAGWTLNSDGTWTLGKFTFDPNKKPKYPILSHRYSNNVVNIGALDKIPKRAFATVRVIKRLEEIGAKVLELSRLKQIPFDIYDVNSGLQVVVEYEDWIIIYETKVGVNTSSAGTLVFIGTKEQLKNPVSTTHISSKAAFDTIIKKLNKLEANESIDEDFEDVFQPHSEEEIKKRIPKGAVVLTTNLWYDNRYGGLVAHRSYDEDEVNVHLYLNRGTILFPIGGGEYESIGGEHVTTLDPEWYKPYYTNEAFEDVFKPASEEDLDKRDVEIQREMISDVVEGWVENFGDMKFKNSKDVLNMLSNLMHGPRTWGAAVTSKFYFDDKFRKGLENTLLQKLRKKGNLREDFEDTFQPISKKEYNQRKAEDKKRRNPAEARRLLSKEIARVAKDHFGNRTFSVTAFINVVHNLLAADKDVLRVLYKRLRFQIQWDFWDFHDRCGRILDMAVSYGDLETQHFGDSPRYEYRVPKSRKSET